MYQQGPGWQKVRNSQIQSIFQVKLFEKSEIHRTIRYMSNTRFTRFYKIYEFKDLGTYRKMSINLYDFYFRKWIEPNNSFPFHKFDSGLPNKIVNTLKPNN